MADYQPGACNIGRAERRKRYQTGVASFGATALVVVAVLVVDADPVWLLATVAPLFGGFLGVMQARAGFCAGFALAGVYDVSDAGGQRRAAPEDGQRADRRRAIVLPLKALGAATVCAVAVYAVGTVAL